MGQKRIDIYDNNGFVETIYEDVPDIEIPIDDLISQKEDELLIMYEQLERLKALKNL